MPVFMYKCEYGHVNGRRADYGVDVPVRFPCITEGCDGIQVFNPEEQEKLEKVVPTAGAITSILI